MTLDQSTPQEVMDAYNVKERIHDIINKDRYKIEGDYFLFASTMDYPVLRIALDALPKPGKKQKAILDKKLSLLRNAKGSKDNPATKKSTSNPSQKSGGAPSSSSRSSHRLHPTFPVLDENSRFG